MTTLRFSLDATPGDAWGPAGLLGLSAALGRDCTAAPVPLDELLAVADRRLRIAPESWWGGAAGTGPEVLDCLHEGFARSLVGHGRHRRRDPVGRLEWTCHAEFRRDWLTPAGVPRGTSRKARGGGVALTRGILPNWLDGGEVWPLDRVAPLWFAPLACVALPLPAGGAVLAVPQSLDFGRAAEVCRAVTPTDPADCWPASAADAALQLHARLAAAGCSVGRVVGWHYRFVAGNNKFREVARVVRADRPGEETARRWTAFAAATKPGERVAAKTGQAFRAPHRLRGLVADNLIAGRRPYEGYAALARDGDQFKYDGPAARAFFKHFLGA